VKHDLRKVEDVADRIMKDLSDWSRDVQRMSYMAKAIVWFQGRIKTAKEEVRQIVRHWRQNVADLTSGAQVEDDNEGLRRNSLRPKRQIVALLGAAGLLMGFFSFGVGVSNQKELTTFMMRPNDWTKTNRNFFTIWSRLRCTPSAHSKVC